MTTVALGDVVDFYSGGTPSKSKESFWHGDVPWISAKDMKHARLTRSIDHISEDVFSSTSLRRLPVGTIVVVVRGMILAHTIPIGVLEVEAAINQDLKALLPREEIVPAYLAAMLRAQHADILAQVSTAAHGTKKLESRVLENIQIPLPPIEEQRRIADLLDRADALRAQRREAIALLENLTESIFLDMFGDPVSNPRGWAISTVGNLCQVQGGLQVSAARTRHERKTPYLRVANVHRGHLDLDEIKYIGLTENELLRTELTKGDLLVVEGHGNPEEIGRVAIWDGSIKGCVHQNHLIRVRCSEPDLLPEFAEAYLNSRGGRRFLLRSGKTTSGLNTISTSDVKQTPIALPPADRQREFAERLASVDRLAELNAVSDAESNDLFAALQDRAFAGLL